MRAIGTGHRAASREPPPTGNGQFDQLDIIAALAPGHYLTGSYAAIGPNGAPGDDQTSIIYVPEPSALVLVACGLVGLVGLIAGRRRRVWN